MNSRSLMLALAWPLAAAATPPDPLVAPPADARLALTLAARGVQVYECRDGAWAFVAPEAELLDAQGRVVGSHGAGPHWALADGSRVGGRVQARADAPGGAAIPWLLLAAAGAAPAGPGALDGVSHIQRVHTQGGLPPAGPCASPQSARVGYTADYRFFRRGP